MSLSSVIAQPKRQTRESGPRQKLTTDYLAKQLPVFQERAPKNVQVSRRREEEGRVHEGVLEEGNVKDLDGRVTLQ